MLGAVLSFAAMAIAVRELQRHMGTQILALRTGMTLVIVAVLVTAHGHALIATQRFTVHATRALVHLLGQDCAFGALATVFAIEFTMPVWTALLAAAFLGERQTQGRCGARSPLADGQRRSVDALQAAQRYESNGSGNSQRN